MTPTGTQITDMLLGFVPTDGMEPVAGQSSSALNGGGLLFGDLLGGLVQSGVRAGASVSPENVRPWIGTATDILQPLSLLPTPDALISDASIIKGDEVVDQKITSLPFDTISYRGQDTALVDSKPDPTLGALVNDGESGIEDNTVAVTINSAVDNSDNKLNAFLPIAGAISTRHLMNLVEASKSTIEPGRYQITESSLANGKVSMQVVDTENVSNAFKVSIPLTDLNEAVNQSKAENGIPNRVSLDSGNNPVAKIEKFISSLNLKEIEVKAERPGVNVQAKVTPAEETTSFVITAEKAGRQLSMRARVNRNRVQIKSDSPRQAPDDSTRIAAVMPVKNINGASPATTVISMPRQNQLFDPEQTFRFGVSTGSATGSMLEANADEGSAMKNAVASMSTQADDTAGKLGATTSPRATYSARLSLPDDVSTRQQLSAKSIMLKIEPEHLGPARLHLMMRNDQLVAHVVVNSVNARAAIEGGLEDLARQLNEANIDVESIDVSVAGDRDERDQFAHRTFWGYRASSQSGKQAGLGMTEDNETSVNQYVPPPTYVGADGVNILA